MHYLFKILGWYLDTAGYLDVTSTNQGFRSRNKLFRKEGSATKDYHGEAVPFMGRLQHDLHTPSGILPGLGLRVELEYASPQFVLQTTSTDTSKYTYTIETAKLLCPVGQLTTTVFNRIEQHLSRESARLYINRIEVTNKNIPSNSKNPVELLFPGARLPSRLIMGLLPSETYNGKFTKNVYNFQRTFGACGDSVQALPEPPAEMREESTSNRGKKGTGVGKRSTASGIIGYMTRTAGSNEGHGGDAEEEDEEEDFHDVQEDLEAVGDICYLESVQVQLNGESLDGFQAKATKNQDIMNYIRMNHYLGFMSTRTGNALTLQEFHKGMYLLVFDLTTSSQAGLQSAVSAVRTGTLQAEFNFSCPTPSELTLLLFAEYSDLITIDKNRQVSMSY